MRLVRPEIAALPGYVPGEQPPAGQGWVKLNTNENPYPPAPAVLEAVRAEAERLRLYPHPTGGALRERLASLHGVAPDQVLLGNGSDDCLALLVRAVASPGEATAAPDPSYSLYPTLAAFHGARHLAVPYPADYSLPAEWPEARLYFLTNPNSPSGTVASPEAVAALARRLPGLLVVDEAYAEFADTDCLGLLGRVPNLAIVRTFSKSHSLAGLRLGYCVGPPELVAGLAKLKDSYNVNRLAIAAGLAALDSKDRTRANVEQIRRTRGRLSAALSALGFFVHPSGANFVLARVGSRAREVQEALARRKILVRWFDHPRTADCLRISIGTDEETDVFLDALRKEI